MKPLYRRRRHGTAYVADDGRAISHTCYHCPVTIGLQRSADRPPPNGFRHVRRFLCRRPANTDGATTQGVYICVNDIDAHYARAKDAGAEITRDLQDTDYGSREYTARDPEGHLWGFGTYLPHGV